MKIIFKGEILSEFLDWGNIVFVGKKEKHWKKGRSAYSLANFIVNQNGLAQIQKILSPIINEEFTLYKASPEFEARFDNYGHGREHDLAIWGNTKSGKTIFIGLEAKVDESFGDTIATAQKKATAKLEKGKNTNALKRINELLSFNFDEPTEQDLQLRYQLLFSTAGTLCVEAEIHIMLILVFKTEKYSPKIGAKNYGDLMCFLEKANAKIIDDNTYQLSKNNKELTLLYKEIVVN